MFTCTPSASSSAATIGADSRNGDAFEALKQFRLSAGRAGDVAEPSNLGRAREGDRVDLASSHLGDDSDHARIVRFGSVDIRKHGIRFRPGTFEEFQKPLICVVGIELHADTVPIEIVPFQRRDHSFGRGFVRGHVGRQSDLPQRPDWLWPARDPSCRAQRGKEGGFQGEASGKTEEPPQTFTRHQHKIVTRPFREPAQPRLYRCWIRRIADGNHRAGNRLGATLFQHAD